MSSLLEPVASTSTRPTLFYGAEGGLDTLYNSAWPTIKATTIGVGKELEGPVGSSMSGRYVFLMPVKTERQAADRAEEFKSIEDELALLTPVERMRLLARRQPTDLVVFAFGIVLACGILVKAVSVLWLPLIHMFSLAAWAQGRPEQLPTNGPLSLRGGIEAFFAEVVLCVVLFMFAIGEMRSKNAAKIRNCHEISRLLIGGLMGFLGGGKLG